MKTNVFHDASIKLAAIYALIIVGLSLVFSFWLYNVSLAEIRQSVMRAPGPVEQLLRRENSRFAEELGEIQDQAITDARKNLLYQFTVLNSVIAVGGAVASYYFARRTLRPIEEAHEAQSRFTADASHELRTPITAMRFETELTLTEPKLTLPQARKQLESNIEELDKLTALSDGLLQLARLEHADTQTEPCAVDELIEEARSRVTPIYDKRNQTISYKKSTATLLANRATVSDILVVLLDNASKYSPEKSIVTIAVKETKKDVHIAVSDLGIGIKASELPHIFDRFYRADQSRNKTHTSGYGLGLAIAQGNARAYQGDITVKSTPNKGSTFTLTLPRSV